MEGTEYNEHGFHEEARRIQIFNEKWKVARTLFRELRRKETIFLRHYSHYCFTNESKNGHIKRYTFTAALKQYAFSSKFVHLIYTTFDTSGLEQFDWRELGFILFTISRPNSKPREDLEYAYKFVTGSGLLDVGTPTLARIRLREVERIFSLIIRPAALPSLLNMFYSCWGSTVMLDSNKVMDAINTEKVFVSAEIVIDIIKDICSKSSSIDEFEERYYPSELFRLRRSTRLVKHALNTISFTAMKVAIARWKEVIHRRKVIQSTCRAMFSKLHRKQLSHAFLAMKKFAVQTIAAVELQRLFRGHIGRSTAKFELEKEFSAILLQTFFRGVKARAFCTDLFMRRIWAAIEIQRIFRGHLDRTVAMKRRGTQNALRAIANAKRAEMRKVNVATTSVIKVQRIFREHLTRNHYNKSIEKRRRELAVTHELEQRDIALKQQIDIHAKLVTDHYGRRKAQIIQMNAEEEMIKIQSQLLRRKRFFNGRAQTLQTNKTQREFQRCASLMKRKEEWEKRVEAEVVSFRSHCQTSVRSPVTKSERFMRNRVKKLTTKEITNVFRRADTDHVEMEIKEARILAESEVIEHLVSARKAELESEMRTDLHDFEQQLQTGREKSDAANFEMRLQQANWIICSAVRRWKARKVLRDLAFLAFEKLFDERYKAFYYRNVKTVSTKISLTIL